MADILINFKKTGEEIVTGSLRRVGEIAVDAFGALVGSVGESIKVAGDFQSTLNSFSSVAGDALTDAGMSVTDFSDLFLEMGAKTKYSAGEAATAAVELAKGGLDPATIAAGGLEAALTLAAAGSLELGTAAEITAKQLGVWEDTGVTAADVADLMAQAANASTVNVDELAMGMANVGGVAKVAGASFQDTVQAMALLAPGFSSASDAGTSLKTFLSRMIPASSDAASAMLEMGLASEDANGEIQSNFFDAEGTFIGMSGAAELLQNGLAGLSEAEKLDALGEIFGQDAIRAAAMLGEAGSEGFNDMGEAMLKAGTAAEQAAKLNTGWNFAMESLLGSLETIQIVVGTALLPVLTDLLANVLTPGINIILGFFTAISSGSDPLNAFIEAIEGLGEYEAFQELFKALGIDIYGVSTAFETFATGVQIALQPIIDAFGNLAAAIFGDMGTSKAIIEEFVAGVSERLQFMANFFTTVVIPAIAAIVNFVAENWPTIQATVLAVMTAVNDTISTVLTGIQTFWETWGDDIMAYVQKVFDQVKMIWDIFSAAFSGDWHEFGSLIRDAWYLMWKDIITAVSNALLWFNEQDWGAIGIAILEGIAQGITDAQQALVAAAVQAAANAVAAVQGFLGIDSPSKVFAGIGMNMGLGMVQGLGASEGMVADSAMGVSRAATSAVTNNSGGNTYNYYGVSADTNAAYSRALAGAF